MMRFLSSPKVGLGLGLGLGLCLRSAHRFLWPWTATLVLGACLVTACVGPTDALRSDAQSGDTLDDGYIAPATDAWAPGSVCEPSVDPWPAECGPEIEDFDKLDYEVAPNLEPDVTEAELAQLVAGNTDFAFDLFHEIRTDTDPPENLVFSPLSISYVMAMLHGGARDETASQIASALHFTLPDQRLHAAFNGLDRVLGCLGQTAVHDFRMKLANSLWLQEGLPAQEAYLQLLGSSYQSGLYLADFPSDPEAARLLINSWICQRTVGLIPELLSPMNITPEILFVVVNALYLAASWETGFSLYNTQDAPFHLLDGSQTTVPMMRGERNGEYGSVDGVEVFSLPLDGNDLSMVVILPPAGSYEQVVATVNRSQLETWLASLQPHLLGLAMPRFSVGLSMDLSEMLKRLGMELAWTDGADFSGITQAARLSLSFAVHQAVIEVDENGVKAAAATAAGGGGEFSGPTPIPIDANRPFLFLIRDNRTNTVLFLGKLESP